MKETPVVFIAAREYENLGIGYMAAVLSQNGFKTRVIDFNQSKKDILRKLRIIDPFIVGFSVIYQYHIDKFSELISYLRDNGIRCHFTAGGHYASIKYTELFELVPWLDSVLRFEGEYPMLELTKSIYSGTEWRNMRNLVYRNNDKLIVNPLRPLQIDLDSLPFPQRTSLTRYAFDKKFALILAGRGCIHNCSFCNLKAFYRPLSGPARRTRLPEKVAEEMETLFRKRKCRVFLFQDDDFPVNQVNEPEWIYRFCQELKTRGLKNKIIWKINCRPDEVTEALFSLLKNNGLFLVFLGIEDGTDSGLSSLNKNMTIEQSLEGIRILKKLKIGFDFGFLLFQPATTFRSLYENLNFLLEICGDGYSPVTYLKLMPYYESEVEKELESAGRINGIPGYRDYDFIEEQMNRYFEFITMCFLNWTRDPGGLVNILKWARNFFLVYSRFYGDHPGVKKLHNRFKRVVSVSNRFFLNSMKEMAGIFESGHLIEAKKEYLESSLKSIRIKHDLYVEQIKNIIIELNSYAEAYECLSF
jgi:anaerobic magnesium-protoporphyrin IX monomethyl ester cyclase